MATATQDRTAMERAYVEGLVTDYVANRATIKELQEINQDSLKAIRGALKRKVLTPVQLDALAPSLKAAEGERNWYDQITRTRNGNGSSSS